MPTSTDTRKTDVRGRPRPIAVRAVWTSCLVFLLAFAFAPLRPAPREAEGELTESEEQLEGKTEARAIGRDQRRATKRSGPSIVAFAGARAPMRIVATHRVVVRQEWQRPRRTPPPDDDDDA